MKKAQAHFRQRLHDGNLDSSGKSPVVVPLAPAQRKGKRRSAVDTSVKRTKWYLGPGVEVMPDMLHKYETGDWLMEPKIDGMWCMLEVAKEGRPHVLNSRDAKTGPIMGSNLGDLHLQPLPFPPGTILVGELEAATQAAKAHVDEQGFRRLHVFDVPMLGGLRYGAGPLRERRRHIKRFYERFKKESSSDVLERFPLLPFYTENFQYEYDRITGEDGEGVVLKHLDSTYAAKRADGKTEAWLRCKKWVTHDFVLMGETNTPGGVHSAPKKTGVWGLYDAKGRLKPVMKAPPKPIDLLRPENYGVLVAEFMGWAHFKSGALRHGQFVRVHPDKSPEACLIP
jgi:hypothetical protein